MLTIRREQFAILAEAEVQKFEEWMVVHLRRFFPKQCTVAGDAQLRETIRYGIRRAAVHGITVKRDVAKYIDLMIVFGRDFDTDGRMRWAAEILGRQRPQGMRVRALLKAAKVQMGSR
jgi:hypothetical protein